jgi:hypothetical protein
MNFSWKILLGSIAFLGLTACNSINSRGVSSEERAVFQNNEVVVSRVKFQDAATARKIAISIEPIQTNYDQGYMLIDTGLEDFSYLRDQESSLNISIELDQQITAQQTKVLERFSQGAPAVSQVLRVTAPSKKPLRQPNKLLPPNPPWQVGSTRVTVGKKPSTRAAMTCAS